jgi:signal transduction histidine kinase
LQCLLNLSLNALQAMPDGGTLVPRCVESEPTKNSSSRANSRAAGAYLKIAVKDTGIGMNEEVKANLFKAFFTTKRRHRSGPLSCRRIRQPQELSAR